jgi:hypothetical protein
LRQALDNRHADHGGDQRADGTYDNPVGRMVRLSFSPGRIGREAMDRDPPMRTCGREPRRPRFTEMPARLRFKLLADEPPMTYGFSKISGERFPNCQ